MTIATMGMKVPMTSDDMFSSRLQEELQQLSTAADPPPARQ